MTKIEELTGVLPALVSPLRRDGSADERGIKRLVEHVIAGGVDGVLALGSTGEGAALGERTRSEVLICVVEAVAGRVPVLCGVAQPHLEAAQAAIATASRLGAHAALVAPPFYYLTDQATVLAFYRRLAADAKIPLLLYNIPQFTKVYSDPATVAQLAAEGTIAGMKDSSRDFEYFQNVRLATRDMPRFRLFTGSDTMLLASMAMGGAGTICGAANIAPSWVVRIFDDVRRGDWKSARADQEALIELVNALRVGVFPATIKASLQLQGICEPWPAPPTAALDEASTAKLRERLDKWGLLSTPRD
ncbi:MAG TPA: dihydrodipicolinate synthase family protein [Candidatus Dormibacteraeota bacterium]|nr:dihydrodipicolinate synthase family protein [Candidatus Dormibacteraeota bacterium]